MVEDPPIYSDEEFLPKRCSKRHIPQPKFFIRDEDSSIYEDGLENAKSCDTNFDDLPLLGKRFDKPQKNEPKFFRRDESIVYENNHDYVRETDRVFEKNTKYPIKNDFDVYGDSKHEAIMNNFRHEDYDLFNHRRERSSSDEEDDDDDASELDESELNFDADDEFACSELDEDDFEGKDMPTNSLNDGNSLQVSPFFTDHASFEKNTHLFAQLTKRTRRVFPKRMRHNPLRGGEHKSEEEEVIDVEQFSDIKMPPDPPDENWYPKPGDPEYIEPIPIPPGIPFKPWVKQVREILLSDDESTEDAGSLRSDYITETSENYSTETYIDSDELSTCPEDEPLYPQIPEEFYMKPETYEVENEFMKIPEGNPEVRTWYDCKGRQYLDVKNEKGEWETKEEVIPEYPLKPKHPDRWMQDYEPPKNRPENCTCGEVDLTGWYDKYSKYQPPDDEDNKSGNLSNNSVGNSTNVSQNNEFKNCESQNKLDAGFNQFENNDNSTVQENHNTSTDNITRQNNKKECVTGVNKTISEDAEVNDKHKISKEYVINSTSLKSNDRGNTCDSDGSSGDENNPGDNVSNGFITNNKTNKHINNITRTQKSTENPANKSSNYLNSVGNDNNVLVSRKFYKEVNYSNELKNRKIVKSYKERRKRVSLGCSLRFDVIKKTKLFNDFDRTVPWILSPYTLGKNNKLLSKVNKLSMLEEAIINDGRDPRSSINQLNYALELIKTPRQPPGSSIYTSDAKDNKYNGLYK